MIVRYQKTESHYTNAFVGGLFFEMTCAACPEQYDVWADSSKSEYVGYVRLRHGYLRADCAEGNVVYSSYDLDGDGAFDIEAERSTHLINIAGALMGAELPNSQGLVSLISSNSSLYGEQAEDLAKAIIDAGWSNQNG